MEEKRSRDKRITGNLVEIRAIHFENKTKFTLSTTANMYCFYDGAICLVGSALFISINPSGKRTVTSNRPYWKCHKMQVNCRSYGKGRWNHLHSFFTILIWSVCNGHAMWWYDLQPKKDIAHIFYSAVWLKLKKKRPS